MAKHEDQKADDKGNEGGSKGPPAKKYIFFVGRDKYETDQPKLTGAQIKARAPNVEPGDQLSLEGHGNEPDRIIADTDVVSLDSEHGPRRFHIVPQANFG